VNVATGITLARKWKLQPVNSKFLDGFLFLFSPFDFKFTFSGYRDDFFQSAIKDEEISNENTQKKVKIKTKKNV
jgi:hypothetical protein